MAVITAGAKPARREPWKVILFIVVLLIGISVLLAGMWFIPTSMRLELWIVVLVLLSALAAVIGYVINRRWLGILIDQRNKVSLSRFQTVLWLILILSAFLTIGLSNLHIALLSISVDAPLAITLPTEL